MLFGAWSLAACSGSGGSPNAGTAGPATTPTPVETSTTSPASSHDIAGVPDNLAPSEVFADLTGTPTSAADPQLVDLARSVREQLGDALTGPIPIPTVAPPAGLRRRSGLTDLLVLDLLITGQSNPSNAGAEALTSLAKYVGQAPGLDGPDGPSTEQKKTDAPFNTSNASGSMSGGLTNDLTVSSDHSLVTADLTRSLQGTFSSTTESQSLSVTIHNVESVDFCPDASGAVPVDIQSDFTMSAGTTTVQFEISGKFTGQVNDNADLANVTGEATSTGAKVIDGATQDDYSVNINGLDFPVNTGGVGAADGGKWQSGSNSSADLDAKVSAVMSDIAESLKTVFKDVQGLWQNSSCVTAQIPDFNTFAGQSPPSDVDFVRDVDPGSTKEFTTQVHHRFLHTNVNAPVTQTLSTEVRLDPPTLSSTPGKSTYEAPNKVGQGNDATFESRSRRGRSVLKGRFYVDEKPPTIGITGTITSTAAAVTLTGQMTMSPVAFTNQSIADDGHTTLYSVDAPVSATITASMAGAAFPCAAYGTEQGTIHLVAHSEPRGEHDRVWVIHPDPAQSHFDATTTCLITVGKAFSGGSGISAKFFAALGDFEIPFAPATTALDKQRALPLGSDHSQASVTLLPPPP